MSEEVKNQKLLLLFKKNGSCLINLNNSNKFKKF